METCAPDGAGAEEKMTVVIILNGEKRKPCALITVFKDFLTNLQRRAFLLSLHSNGLWQFIFFVFDFFFVCVLLLQYISSLHLIAMMVIIDLLYPFLAIVSHRFERVTPAGC